MYLYLVGMYIHFLFDVMQYEKIYNIYMSCTLLKIFLIYRYIYISYIIYLYVSLVYIYTLISVPQHHIATLASSIVLIGRHVVSFKSKLSTGFWRHTRWAPTSCKWSCNPYKWPYKCVTGIITLLIGVKTPVITGKGPPCMDIFLARCSPFL